MLKLTKTGIGLLTRQYRSVLKKCWLINVGLWQAMGDAVSKAVSVPARLVASLLSGGALSGEAFNVLDEILLSRLFERKLASLTAIGLTIAAVTMPSNAEAATPTEVLNLLNTGNETWTISGSSEQPVSFNETTKKATGTIGVPIDNAITYYTYTYTMPSNYTSQSPITTLTADNAVNKYFYNISQTVSSGTSYIFAYPVNIYNQVSSYGIKADFIKNSTIATNSIHADGSAVAIRQSTIKGIEGNFIGNTASSDYLTQGGAIHFVDAKMDYLRGDFINNIGYGGQAIGGAFSFHYLSKIDSIEGLYVRNGVIGTSAIGGAFATDIGSDGTPMIQSISANFIGNYAEATTSYARGGAIYNTGTITNIGTATNKVTFSGNYAKSESGSASGGAIYNAGTIDNIYADFTGNYVTTGSGFARGGSIYNTGTIGSIGSANNKVIFQNNIVEVVNDSSEAYGAGIDNTGKIDYIYADFINNQTKGKGYEYASYTDGTAIANFGEIGTITGNISGSSVNNQGGGLYNGGIEGGSIKNLNINFTGNSAMTGGAISNEYGTIESLTGIFTNNTAISSGGAISTRDGTMKNVSGQFIENKAGYGGAMWIALNIENMYNTYFEGNIASTRGGAIEIAQRGSIGFSGTNTFTNNTANSVLNDIYNAGTINITSGTTQLNSGYDGTASAVLNISSGATFDLNENNNQLHTSNLGVLTNSGTFRLGLDIQHPTSGTTGSADLFALGSGSSGSILIDAINEIGGVAGRPTATGTYLYQVLNGSGVTLAVDTALRNAWASRKITTGSTTPDTIAATTNWGTTYYYRTPYDTITGALDTSGNNLVYTVSSITSGEDLEKMGDTLALVTTATNNASRIFSTTDATAEYLLSTNLGAVNAVYKNLSINGTVSGNNRSTLNLGNYNGFVLDSSDDNLSLSSMKVSGGSDYSVNLANSGSNLNVANVIMDSTAAPITGAGNVEFTGDNEINAKVLNTGTTTVSSGTTDFNDEVAGFTVAAPATVSIAADDITAETTNNGTLELEGGNVTTKLMGTGRMKLMSGNVRLLSSTPPATTGSLSFGSSSDYADSILTSSSAASTSDHALVTAGYLDNNYYMNYGDSMAKSFIKAANDNHKTVIVRSAKHDVTIFGRQSDNTARTTQQAA